METRLNRYNAYIDESGTHVGSAHLTVALALIPDSAEDAFETRWTSLLTRYGIHVFHMTDFNSCQGEFTNWSPERCHDFSLEIVDTVKAHVVFWMGNTIETVSAHLIEDEVAVLSPYIVGCAFLLKQVGTWVANQKDDVQIAYAFEDGVRDQHKFDRALKGIVAPDAATAKRFGYLSHAYRPKSVAGLQVADMLAWQLHVDGRRYDAGQKRRGDLLSLLEIPHLVGHFDSEALQLVRKGILHES